MTGEKNTRPKHPAAFLPGNQAAVGNRGGGRPAAPYRAEVEAYSSQSLAVLWAVATDPAHPWHELHGFAATRELARICTPRLAALEPPPEPGALTFVDLARAMIEAAA